MDTKAAFLFVHEAEQYSFTLPFCSKACSQACARSQIATVIDATRRAQCDGPNFAAFSGPVPKPVRLQHVTQMCAVRARASHDRAAGRPRALHSPHINTGRTRDEFKFKRASFRPKRRYTLSHECHQAKNAVTTLQMPLNLHLYHTSMGGSCGHLLIPSGEFHMATLGTLMVNSPISQACLHYGAVHSWRTILAQYGTLLRLSLLTTQSMSVDNISSAAVLFVPNGLGHAITEDVEQTINCSRPSLLPLLKQKQEHYQIPNQTLPSEIPPIGQSRLVMQYVIMFHSYPCDIRGDNQYHYEFNQFRNSTNGSVALSDHMLLDISRWMKSRTTERSNTKFCEIYSQNYVSIVWWFILNTTSG
ncbi:hypothetical protein J6590_012630 [Homalodisca vitripennis]|nr:hypothetical protein J6590_012630 [Homalodisca vitripennis]